MGWRFFSQKGGREMVWCDGTTKEEEEAMLD
jgi:hypothetical protein